MRRLVFAVVWLVAACSAVVPATPSPTVNLDVPSSTGPVVRPLASPSPATSPSASPTSAPAAATPAPPPATPVDDAGIFGSGGLWAVSGGRLFRSPDRGRAWASSRLAADVAPSAVDGDSLSSVVVLDATRAWTASPGPGSTVPYSGQGPGIDHLHVIVRRTTDGGATWKATAIAGDWGGTQPVLAFADPRHGFLLLAGLRFGPGSVVFATDDGGATFRRAGGAERLGSVFGATDAETVWAGNEGDAGPVARPILDVSRDGGRTWADAGLPGLVGDVFVNDTAAGVPVFSGQDGAFAVIAASTDTPTDVRFYRTADGGRTWELAATSPLDSDGTVAAAVMDATHFVVVGPGAGLEQVSDDGGQSWRVSPTDGLDTAVGLRFWDAAAGIALVPSPGASGPDTIATTSDGGESWLPVVLPAG
jgi:hypothetical protein